MKKFLLLSALVIAVLWSFAGCKQDEGGGFTVSGAVTIEPPISSGESETLDIAMDTSSADFATAASTGDLSVIDHYVAITVPDRANWAAFEFNGVKEGTYHLGGSIDIDGDGEYTDGDYYGSYADVDPMSGTPVLEVSDDNLNANFRVEEMGE